MTSTLQLVERLKAQLAESRADLCSKEHAFEQLATSRSEASEAALSKEGKEGNSVATRDCDSVSCSSRSKSEPCLQAQITALQEELQQKSQSLAAKMVGLVTSTKGLSQQLILERQQRLAFEDEVRVLMEAKTSPAQAAEARHATSDFQQLKQEVKILESRTQRIEERLEASLNAIFTQLGPAYPSAASSAQQVVPVRGPAHLAQRPLLRQHFGPECLPAFRHEDTRLPFHPHQAAFEPSLRQLREEVADLRQHSEVMQQDLEAAIEAVACQLSSVTAWVQQNLSSGVWPPNVHPPPAMQAMQDVSAAAARFPQLSPILEDRCVGEAAQVQVQDRATGIDEFGEELLPFLRLLVDDVPQMVKRMTENSQTLLEKINLERADRLACEARIGEELQRLDERVESVTARPPTLLHSIQHGAVHFDEKGRMAPACTPRPLAIQRCRTAPHGLGFGPGVDAIAVSGGSSGPPVCVTRAPACGVTTPRTPRDLSVKADGEGRPILEPVTRSCN